jgi:predicted ATPase/DNA-binding winged helix-turn-helix (wHTH) protein
LRVEVHARILIRLAGEVLKELSKTGKSAVVRGAVLVSRGFEIGPFRLDPDVGVLTRDGKPTALGPRGVAVLKMLVEHATEHVAKARIIDAAWPGLVVEEHNLAVQVNAIRRTLAETPGGEHWIETLPRRGYRFVGPVKEFIQDQRPDGAGAALRSNLPAPLTSFVGRERELVEIKRLLASRRLVTIVGGGGIGKTRLALQVAAELVDAYGDGVWLAELGAIRDPSLVPTTVAQALGVRESVGIPIPDSLRAYLRPRQVLLVLDNCEHLLTACAKLTDALLQDANHLAFLATGRESLGIAGEQSYLLGPLLLPERGSKLEAVRQSEAVQLFIERVQRQLPDFELTPDRAPVVAELCIHLDGIPLALELAAARARSLSVEQVNARLVDRFRLLTGGSRTALPRQQTLRATLDWSYDLLAEDERVALRRLSIFPSNFNVEAASAVASDATIDEFAVVDLLLQLVARSLVIADVSVVGTRYRLLETTRAYALEKLAEVGETDAIRHRHAGYLRDRFERATADWFRMPDAHWHATYLPELDNVRVALDWAFGLEGDAAIGIALAGASGPMWLELSLHGEGRQRLESAVARIGLNTPQLDHARLCLWLGVLWSSVAPVQALAVFEQAIDLYRRSGDALGNGFSLVRLGAELAFMGRFDQALPALEKAFPVLERVGVPKALGEYFRWTGSLKIMTGDPTSARTHLERALSLYRGAGAERYALHALGNLADITWALGDLDAALAGFRETVALQRKLPLTTRVALGRSLTNLAGVLTERGELDDALAAAREGLPLLKDADYAWGALDYLALRAALTGKLASATCLAGFADSTYAAKESPRQPNEARARERLQTILREKLGPEELERLLAEGAQMTEDEACRLALEE